MNKKKLIEVVQWKLTGGSLNPDVLKKYPDRVVSEHIGLALNTLLFEVFKLKSDALDSYAKDFTVDLVNNDGWECTVPKSPMQFPGNNTGIQRISLKSDLVGLKFLPLSTMATGTLGRLGVVNRSGLVPYRYSAGKVLFSGNLTGYEQVVLSLVLPFGELDDTDEIMIPLGTGVSLVDTIVNLIASPKPQDSSNNNNADS